VPDYSWLPDLVEIGGFQFEAGCRDVASWSVAMASLFDQPVARLLPEVWQCIPRSAAEKFGALVNNSRSELERMRLGEAYRRLNFGLSKPEPAAALAAIAGAAESFSDVPPGGSEAPNGGGTSVPERQDSDVHNHTCANCGMVYSHEAWQCEPPDDQYCNLCGETVGGPLPVWIARLAEPDRAKGEEAEAEPTGGPGRRRRSPRAVAGRKIIEPVVVADSLHNPGPNEERRPMTQSTAEQQGAPTPTEIAETAPKSNAVEETTSTPAAVAARHAHQATPDLLAKTPNPTERGFAKVAGMHELKKLLYEEVITALRDPDDLKAYGLTIPNGILLFGPPGCGKTYISRHLAEEMNYFFKEVFPSEIGSTFIHETTLKIREVFDYAYQHAPAIIFVDEFESMVPARRNLGAHQQHTAEEVSEFLKQLEASAERKILLIAATNEPWKIDPAVQRTGRLDKKIYVGPPDKGARAEMLRFHLYGRRQEEQIDTEALADALTGYSASDLKLLVDEAARLARQTHVPISEAHLRTAAQERVPPSVSAEDERKYLSFGQRGVKTPETSYVESNSTSPDHRQADLVHKWGRGRPAGRGSSRNIP
jgi:AAA+ superfamily predicted ATPase